MIETRDKNGELHSFDDKPSIVSANGRKFWCKHGKWNRIGEPCYMNIDRWKEFLQEDNWFNNKGPDIINVRFTLWDNRYTIGDFATLNWQDFSYD